LFKKLNQLQGLGNALRKIVAISMQTIMVIDNQYFAVSNGRGKML